MSPMRSRRRAGRRTEKSPSRAELSAASSASSVSTFAPVPSSEACPFAAVLAGAWAAAVFVPFDARRLPPPCFFAAGFFCVLDRAVAPALAGLLLPPLVRGSATAPLLLHESQRSSERYSPCKAPGDGRRLAHGVLTVGTLRRVRRESFIAALAAAIVLASAPAALAEPQPLGRSCTPQNGVRFCAGTTAT